MSRRLSCSPFLSARVGFAAFTYRAILDVLLEKRSSGVVGWNTWHVSDAHGWHWDRYPSLFDDKYEPKPAYFAVREALVEHSRLEE